MTMYWLVAVVFLGGFLLIHRIIHSPFGQVLKAIRENEPRATSLGYRTDDYKLIAFVLSCMLAGVAGGTKALVFGIATLTDVHYSTSGEVVLTTLLGGLGTVFGPVMGAVLVTAMENYLAQFGAVGDGDAGRDLRDLRAGLPPRRHRRDRRRAAAGAVATQDRRGSSVVIEEATPAGAGRDAWAVAVHRVGQPWSGNGAVVRFLRLHRSRRPGNAQIGRRSGAAGQREQCSQDNRVTHRFHAFGQALSRPTASRIRRCMKRRPSQPALATDARNRDSAASRSGTTRRRIQRRAISTAL